MWSSRKQLSLVLLARRLLIWMFRSVHGALIRLAGVRYKRLGSKIDSEPVCVNAIRSSTADLLCLEARLSRIHPRMKTSNKDRELNV